LRSELPTLTRALIRQGIPSAVVSPTGELLDLPERAVQFGTGAFLRGFVDAFLDDANRGGTFGGRVVAVGSTRSGRERALNAQDGLYTLVLRGLKGGEPWREGRVISSVSRALSAQHDWQEVLGLARTPHLEFVFSNTTEVGITLSAEDGQHDQPPPSFPGKITRFLFERAQAFDYSEERGIIVLPCELIENNGDQLRTAVLTLATRWGLPARFAAWLDASVPFCNTLVDRIVAGTPAEPELSAWQTELGYKDALLTVGEPYCLFAIQADHTTASRLRFAAGNDGIVVTDDIAAFRERKVRLLNGAHTMLGPLALLCGCRTVHDALEHPLIAHYTTGLLTEELVPTVDRPGAREFAHQVIERFRNPFIEHALIDLTLQSTTKLRVRVLPSLQTYVNSSGQPPPLMAMGFAAFLLFQRGDVQDARRKAGVHVPDDDWAHYFQEVWKAAGTGADSAQIITQQICSNQRLWGADLEQLAGWVPLVSELLRFMLVDGVPATLATSIQRPALASGAWET
jgi:tagaturonate reductase